MRVFECAQDTHRAGRSGIVDEAHRFGSRLLYVEKRRLQRILDARRLGKVERHEAVTIAAEPGAARPAHAGNRIASLEQRRRERLAEPSRYAGYDSRLHAGCRISDDCPEKAR